MRWFSRSKPRLYIPGVLTLFQLASAISVTQNSNNAGAIAFGHEDYSADAIMDAPRRSIYSSDQYNTMLNPVCGLDKELELDRDNDSNAELRLLRNPKWDADLNAPIESLKKWTTDPKNPSRQRRDREPSDANNVWHDVQSIQDSCTIASRVEGPIPYNVVKACLDADFGFPDYLREDTVATIKKLISSFYVFEDLAANPPSVEGLSFLSVDFAKEMDQLLEQSRKSLSSATASDIDGEEGNKLQKEDGSQGTGGSARSHPMTHREFHDGLSRIMSKARDAHLSYDADCFRAFRFQHGFFMNHVVRNDKTVLKVHSVTPYFQELNGIEEDILDCEVVTIAGKDAAEYIQEWADARVSMSKDANIRFNAALVTPQYRSGTVDFFIPGKFSERFVLPEEESLAFTLDCPGRSATDLLEVDARWVGFYKHDVTRTYEDMQSYYNANCIKSPEEGIGYWYERSRLEKKQNPEQRRIEKLKSKLHDLINQSAASTTVAAAPAETLAPPAPTTGTDYTPPTEHPEPSKDALKQVDEIMSMLDMITSEQLPAVKFYDDYGGRLSELNMKASEALFIELYRGQYGISALLLADGKTGVITVRTESSTIKGQPYSRVHPAWAGSLIEAINVLRPRAENLILDLSHNTGGYVCLGLTMVQLFFPDRPRLVTNIRLSPLGTQMMTAGAMGIGHFISAYGEPVVATYQDEYFLRSTSHPHRNLTFTDYLSDRCAIADYYVLDVDPIEEAKRKRAPVFPARDQDGSNKRVYYPWNPENIVILTDGYCGSSCALISNVMHTNFQVKTVVIGGRTPSSTSDLMSYSTFPGLQVIDDRFIFNEMENVRSRLMSASALAKLERGRAAETGGKQRRFALKRRNGPKTEDEDEDEDNDAELLYPLDFAHKSRLRLTWRQIYNTGPEINVFKYIAENRTYEPAWEEVDRWNEYSLIPASVRIDYTDHNVHSIGAIWEDTRNAVWGTAPMQGQEDGQEDPRERQ